MVHILKISELFENNTQDSNIIEIINNNFEGIMGTRISSICIDETGRTKKITPVYIVTRTVYDNFKVKYVEVDSKGNVTQDRWQPIRKTLVF